MIVGIFVSAAVIIVKIYYLYISISSLRLILHHDHHQLPLRWLWMKICVRLRAHGCLLRRNKMTRMIKKQMMLFLKLASLMAEYCSENDILSSHRWLKSCFIEIEWIIYLFVMFTIAFYIGFKEILLFGNQKLFGLERSGWNCTIFWLTSPNVLHIFLHLLIIDLYISILIENKEQRWCRVTIRKRVEGR